MVFFGALRLLQFQYHVKYYIATLHGKLNVFAFRVRKVFWLIKLVQSKIFQTLLKGSSEARIHLLIIFRHNIHLSLNAECDHMLHIPARPAAAAPRRCSLSCCCCCCCVACLAVGDQTQSPECSVERQPPDCEHQPRVAPRSDQHSALLRTYKILFFLKLKLIIDFVNDFLKFYILVRACECEVQQ